MGKLIEFDQPVIEVDHAGIQRGERWLIYPFEWQLRKHQHTAVLGLNGAGKSVLMQLLTGVRAPTTGKIRLFRHDAEAATANQLQQIQAVSLSMEEGIGFDVDVEDLLRREFERNDTHSVAQKHAWSDWEHIVRLTDIQYCFERTFGRLSPGEKLRVLIARALMRSPAILVLDEPTGGLDPIAREQVRHVIASIASEPHLPTMMMMTHKVEDLIPAFRHTIVLHQGRVCKQGLTTEIITDRVLTEIWQVRVHVYWDDHRPRLRIDMAETEPVES
jgi:iron complex transport system ATP-binding protein